MSTTGPGVIELMPPEDVAKLLPPDDSDRFTSLYRLYDQHGNLLYVGVTQSLIARMGQHRLTARWYRDVVRIDVQHFDDRAEAMAAETAAIQTESPRYNINDTSRVFAWDGSRLKRARVLAGLTQVELARHIHGSPTTVAKYEQNKAQPSIHVLVRLARILNVTSDELLGLVPDSSLDRVDEVHEELPPAESLADGMRFARMQRGFMTRAQLADETGIALHKLRFFEIGRDLPNDEELEKIARALGVSTDWLMAGERDNDDV